MNKSDLLFVGIGQAGNNIVSEILKTNKRYNGLFINTSNDDVRGIDNAKNVFIIPATSGTARDRNKAKLYVRDNIYAVIDKINNFPQQSTVYFVFSTGGGTGSGITPTLINVLSRTNPNLNINIVAVLPSREESKKAHENALECWNEMVKLDNVNSYFLIDNNKRDNKLLINKEFSQLFDNFMDTTNSNVNGVIDKAEIEKIGNARGFSAIYNIANTTNEEELQNVINNSIFCIGDSINCKYIGLSIPLEFDYKHIIESYNVLEDYFVGYTDKTPLFAISGIKMTSSAISFVKDNLDYKIKAALEDDEQELELTIDFKKDKKESVTAIKKAAKIDDIIKDEDEFWNDIMNM